MKVLRGTLTDEGVECQALRSEANDLYTLVGNLGHFKVGDRVIVVGIEVPSYCQQGTTLAVTSITAWEKDSEANLRKAGTAGIGTVSRELGHGSYRCLRIGRSIVLHAVGTLPNFNDTVALERMPWRIWPPAFGLFLYKQQTVVPAIRPFDIAALFDYPTAPKSVNVHDADGRHAVDIRELPSTHSLSMLDQQSSDNIKIGYSPRSLQEAFEAAVSQIPPSHTGAADGLVTCKIMQSGMHRGGIVGFDLYFAQVAVTFEP